MFQNRCFYVSKEFYAKLHKVGNLSALRYHFGIISDVAHCLSNYSRVVVISDQLPYKRRTGRIVQKDRFAEYDAADMEWAEPLGLAAWEEKDVHCIQIPEDARFSPAGFKFSVFEGVLC